MLLIHTIPQKHTKQMSSLFKTLIDQGFAIVYVDDILPLSSSKEHMFKLFEQLQLISTKHNLKLAQTNHPLCYSKSNSMGTKLVLLQ